MRLYVATVDIAVAVFDVAAVDTAVAEFGRVGICGMFHCVLFKMSV